MIKKFFDQTAKVFMGVSMIGFYGIISPNVVVAKSCSDYSIPSQCNGQTGCQWWSIGCMGRQGCQSIGREDMCTHNKSYGCIWNLNPRCVNR